MSTFSIINICLEFDYKSFEVTQEMGSILHTQYVMRSEIVGIRCFQEKQIHVHII